MTAKDSEELAPESIIDLYDEAIPEASPEANAEAAPQV